MHMTQFVLAALLAVSVGGAAHAQTRVENLMRCNDDNPDLRIGGCTAIIQAGRETTENLAVAFSTRGSAYNAKGDNDRAIQDTDQAIRLNPNNATAYYNRGNAYRAKGDN